MQGTIDRLTPLFPVRQRRGSGCLAAMLVAAAGLALGQRPALAATATLVSPLDSVAVIGLLNNVSHNVSYCGTFNIQIDNTPPSIPGYCVDINNGISFGDTVPQVPVDYPTEVLWILNNAHPVANNAGTPLTPVACEAAAVQCAIWSYTDNYVCQTSNPASTCPGLASRAAAIVVAANAAAPLTPTRVPQSLSLTPPTASNFLNVGDTTHSVTANLKDDQGDSLAGFSISVQVQSGPGSGNSTSGPSPSVTLNYSNSTAGTDSIKASVSYSVPTGQKFKAINKQGIVLAGPAQSGTLMTTGSKSWIDDTCGNGTVGPGEQCDDGNSINTDACTNACQNARCGDGIIGPGEQCDDGNLSNTDACTNACQSARCGDSFTQAGEQCDDGNQNNTDGCSNSCHLASCGDGITQPGSGEQCDDANQVPDDGCTNSCRLPECGDGITQPGSGEACDDGNAIDQDDCAHCQPNVCGDGVVDLQAPATEECDDGNQVNDDGCNNQCRFGFCGDGITQAGNGEQCDDSNNTDGDGCSAACELQEICTDQVDNDGDGFIDCVDTDCSCPVITPVCGHICSARVVVKPNAVDLLKFNIGFNPTTPMIDPATLKVGVTLTNTNGIVYAAMLQPGDLTRVSTKIWKFRDPGAAKGNGIRGGLGSITVIRKPATGLSEYRINVKAYGDLTQATDPIMTLQVIIGNDAYQKMATWTRTGTGWRTVLH